MPLEIEAKMVLTDRPALLAKLAAAGARRGPTMHEYNIFLDTPDEALKQQGRGLRVRLETHEGGQTPRVVVTYKGPQQAGQLKSREEHQFVADDVESVQSLFAALGYQRRMSFEKRRSRWFWRDCLIELDTVPHLGEFVEIEGPDEATVMAVRQALGLSDQPLIRESYIALLVADQKRRGRGETHIGFA